MGACGGFGAGLETTRACFGAGRLVFGFCPGVAVLPGDAFCAFRPGAIAPNQINAKTSCFTLSLTAVHSFLFGGSSPSFVRPRSDVSDITRSQNETRLAGSCCGVSVYGLCRIKRRSRFEKSSIGKSVTLSRSSMA